MILAKNCVGARGLPFILVMGNWADYILLVASSTINSQTGI